MTDNDFTLEQVATLREFRKKNPNRRRNMSTPRYYKRSPISSNGLWAILVALVIVVLIGGCGGCFYQTQLKESTVKLTVQSKERITESGGSGKYLVFSTDNEAFQVTDNILFGKTDSSNRYAALREGVTYECEAVGVRFSLLSLYKNLINCEEVR